MFKKENRYSFKEGLPKKYISTKYFNLRYGESENGNLHFAAVVGKKIDKRSVIRHKLKRKFSRGFEEIIKERKLPYDFVFFLKRSIIDLDYLELKDEIKKALEKV